MKSSDYFERIPWAIIGIFSMIAVGILIIGYFYFNSQKTRLKQEQQNALSAIADLKSSQIVQWRHERLSDGKIIQENPFIASYVVTLLKKPEEVKRQQALVAWMKSMQSLYGYSNIFLCDTKGTLRLTVTPEGDTVCSIAGGEISEALRFREVLLTDLHRKVPSLHPYMELIVPLVSNEPRKNSAIGVFILQIDIDKVLFPLVQWWPTPSHSAETLLLRREGDSVLYLNELRHRKNTALNLRLPVTNEKLTASMAVLGIEGTVEGVDYRGVPVLAVIRKIQSSPWFMVAKVDLEEVYAPLREKAWIVGIVAFFLILAAASTMGLWWRHQRLKFYREKYETELKRRALITHFEYLIKYANDIILLTNEDLIVVEANDRALQAYGYDYDEIIGFRFVDLYLSVTSISPEEEFTIINEKQGAIYRTNHRRKDGSTFPVELSVRPIAIDGMKFYQVIIRDISERIQAEEALRKSEEQYRGLFENSSIGIYRTTPDGAIILANPTLIRILGYSSLEELSKRNLQEEGFDPSSPRSQFKQRIAAADEIKDQETVWIKKDGSTIYVLESAKAYRGVNGEILYYEGTVEDITEKKRLETILEKERQELKLIIDTSPIIVFYKDKEGRFIRVNKTFAESQKIPEKDFVGKTVFDLYSPKIAKDMTNDDREVLTSGRAKLNIIEPYESADGIRWVQTDKIPIYDKNNNPVGLIGFAQDITERKTAQEALRDSEEKFRLAFENANTGMCLVDTAGNLKRVNNKMCEIFGYSKQELEHMNVNTIAVPEDARLSPEFINKAIAGETENAVFEKRYYHKDGHVILGLLSSSLLHDANGNPSYFISQVQDITEQKRGERALRESEARYRSLFENSLEGIGLSKGNRVIDANKALLNIFGYTDLEEFLEIPLVDHVAPESLNLIENKLKKGRALEPHERRFEYKIICKGGEKRDIEISIEHIEVGDDTFALSTFRDITDRKQVEQALRESEKRFSSIYETVGDVIFLLDVDKDGEFRFNSVNRAFLSTTGLPAEAVVGKLVSDVIPEPSFTLILGKYSQAIRGKTMVRWEETTNYPTGRLTGEVSIVPIFDKEGNCTHLVGAVHDITERKKNEIKILNLNRTYAVLSNVNQLIVRERDRQKILDGACRIAVDDGGFSMAWIGSLKEDSNIITPTASAGLTDNYLEHLNITPSDTPEGRGQIGDDLRNGRSVVYNDIEHDEGSIHWRERALERGYKSSAVYPLRISNKTVGTFSFYSDEVHAFNFEEAQLLDELARDISFALESLEIEEHRKRAEEALQVSEKNFRFFIESAPDAVFVQTQHRFAYLNPAALKLFGADSVDQLLGQLVIDRIHLDFREKIRERIRSVNKEKKSVPLLQQKYLKLDGTVVDVEVSAVLIMYQNHDGALVFVRDITERKQQEIYDDKISDLKQTLFNRRPINEKLKLVTDGLVEIFSADFARVWLIKDADLCDKGCPHAAVSDGPHVCTDRIRCLHLISSSGRYTHTDGGHRRVPFGCYKIGRVASGEDAKFITNDVVHDPRVHDREWAKSLGLVSFSGFRLISAEGKPIGVMALFRKRAIEQYEEQYLEDIASTTSQVVLAGTAEEALIQSNAFNQLLLQTMPFCMDIVDGQGNILFMNDTMKKLVGTEAIGKQCWLAYKDDKLQCQDCPLRHGIEHGKPEIVETGGIFGGKIFQISHIGMAYQGKEALLEVFQDITEQKRLQYQLIQSQKIQSIGTLAGGIAHDFNNILGIIMGYASLLERGGMTNEKFLLNVNAIKQSVERGASLVRHILTFARKTDVSFEPVHIPDLVHDLLSMLRETFSKMIMIKEIIDEDIPKINADRTQLHQALLNLCVNARDAMPNGGDLVITVKKVVREKLLQRFPSADRDYYVIISVTDTGSGMDEETRTRIFDPFFTTKERGKGTGLGLSVVLGVIQTHHGFVDVESTVGVGTTFHLYIPFPQKWKKIQEIQTKEGERIPGGSETILLVEDEILLLEYVRSLLESNGYKVLLANDGQQAIEIYTQYQKDIALVISDMGMPKLGGVDEFKKLREINPEVKIIIASGFLEPGVKNELLQAGVKGITQKPYVPKELLSMIREILDAKPE